MCRVVKVVFLVILVLAMALLPALAGCSSSDTARGATEEGFNIGNLAPGFGLSTPAGQTVFLSEFRGRPVLLNFWASWCGPCRAEMPLLQEVFEDKELSAKGLAVLGVDLGENADTVQTFMKNNRLSFPVVLDTIQVVAQAYNIRAIPTTFFIDKDGIIRDVRIGAFDSKAQIVMGLNKVMP